MREIRASRVMNRDPNLFMNFPISCTLSPRRAGPKAEEQLKLVEWKMSTRTCKQRVLDGIVELAGKSGLNGLRDDILLAADEFMCNVLFNAIHENGVNPLPMNTADALADQPLKEPALVRIGRLDNYIALSCRDPFGSLDPKRLLDRLYLCTSLGPSAAIKMEKTGSAGIGSFMVFNSCTSLYVAVKKRESTQLCAVFPTGLQRKLRLDRPKNLHWIQY